MKIAVSILSVISGFLVMLKTVFYLSEIFLIKGMEFWLGKFIALILSFWIGIIVGVAIYLLVYLLPKTMIERIKKK